MTLVSPAPLPIGLDPDLEKLRAQFTSLELTGRERTEFHTRRVLGSGSCGWVEEVEDTNTGAIYAKKVVLLRGSASSRQNLHRRVTEEVEVLRRLANAHIVSFASAWAERKSFCILLKPAADCDLATYFEDCAEAGFEEHLLAPMKGWFTCLAAGLAYIHENRIRHKGNSSNYLLHVVS
jgi:serine/threonine protein kinase